MCQKSPLVPYCCRTFTALVLHVPVSAALCVLMSCFFSLLSPNCFLKLLKKPSLGLGSDITYTRPWVPASTPKGKKRRRSPFFRAFLPLPGKTSLFPGAIQKPTGFPSQSLQSSAPHTWPSLPPPSHPITDLVSRHSPVKFFLGMDTFVHAILLFIGPSPRGFESMPVVEAWSHMPGLLGV